MNTRSILFLNRVYPPAEGATGNLLADLAEAVAQTGWQVTVLTTRANRTDSRREDRNGVRVERLNALPFPRQGVLRRALSFLLLYPAFCFRALSLPRAAIIVVMTDPPLLAVVGALLGCCTGSRVVHWAQDLYPELAEAAGVLRPHSLAARVLRVLSTVALRQCDAVVAIGQCMREKFEARGLPASRLRIIPNWSPRAGSDLDVATLSQRTEAFRRRAGAAGRFAVMYSGNFGLAHDFTAILIAAERLQTEAPSILFLLVGGGPRRGWVEEEVRRRRLENVRLLPFQPRECLQECLNAGDLHLASMRDEMCGLVVPSKVYGILAAGRPCVFLGPRGSEAARLIEENGCGTVIEAADGPRLSACLKRWASHPERVAAAAAQCRQIAPGLSLEAARRSFLALFEGLLCGKPQRTVTPSPAVASSGGSL